MNIKYAALVFTLLLGACDKAPEKAPSDSAQTGVSSASHRALTAVTALAEIYGNVDPPSTTAVWTRPDPNASEPASFDSVDGIAAQVELVSLKPLGPNRTLAITAARDENPETGTPDRCATCAVLLSAFMFERDAVGWRIIERQEAVAQSTEAQLATAVSLLVSNKGAADVTLAGTSLRFDSNGRLVQRPAH